MYEKSEKSILNKEKKINPILYTTTDYYKLLQSLSDQKLAKNGYTNIILLINFEENS